MLTFRGLEIAGDEVDLHREYQIAINSIFNEIPADGVNVFHQSPCVRLHDELVRDVVIKYLREKRYVSGELPERMSPVTDTSQQVKAQRNQNGLPSGATAGSFA